MQIRVLYTYAATVSSVKRYIRVARGSTLRIPVVDKSEINRKLQKQEHSLQKKRARTHDAQKLIDEPGNGLQMPRNGYDLLVPMKWILFTSVEKPQS